MRINNITYVPVYRSANSYLKSDKKDVSNQNNSYNPIFYKDYNISFSGRTPEDFYAQDFNRNNMPQTMKDYLFFDYQNRQHIPPEQMMNMVFQYIDLADNLEDVKYIYPNEELFNGLHDKPKNSRKGILTEIKIAQELSNTPILKDGNNNFGLYLLKKIYQEGKTLKEIQKDFYEKDMNDEYKGLITGPIQYSTLDAFGIDYPDSAFWHSFINTRDEYKKFFITLPKNTALPGVNINGISHTKNTNSTPTDNNKPVKKYPQRRFNIKPYRKKEIQNDIINKKCTDVEFVKKTIRKRFGKDDPEASFIVRYMSPIMTIAAHRAHMSEEIKGFAQYEREAGKMSDEATMFGRFWKNNPKMLEVFSAGITDTIDMFEDIYAEGGNIPINTDLEEITEDTENKKIIDFVSREFLDLLSYSKTIDITRNEKYALHDSLQKQWEEHFKNRYGEVTINKTEPAIQKPDAAEQVSNEREDAKVYKLKTTDNSFVYITSDLDEVLRDEIKSHAKYFPSRYARMYIKSFENADFPEKFKLTLAARKTGNDFDDEQLMSEDEFNEAYFNLLCEFHCEHSKEQKAARFAILDALSAHSDVNNIDPEVYKAAIYEINEEIAGSTQEERAEFRKIMNSAKSTIDSNYDCYTKPLSPSEQIKVINRFTELLSKFDENKTQIEDNSTIALLMMLKKSMNNKFSKENLKVFIRSNLNVFTYSKSLLATSKTEELDNAKFELLADNIMHVFVAALKKYPVLIKYIDHDVYNMYKFNLHPEARALCESAFMMCDTIPVMPDF